jgi:tetratricopeptide (TPR) repeat protein
LASDVRVHFEIGNIHRQQGNSEAAIDAYQNALSQSDDINDPELSAAILNRLALVYWIYDQYSLAYQTARQVLELPKVNQFAHANAQSILGMIAWVTGRLSQAEEWCLKSAKILWQDPNEINQGGAYNRLGLVYFSMGKLAEAFQAFLQALKVREKVGDLWGQGFAANNLGQVEIERGNFEEANELLGAALALFDRIDSDDGRMVVLANQGRAYLRQSMSAEALPHLNAALDLAEKLDKQSAYGLGDIYLLLGEAQILQENWERARIAVQEGLSIVEKFGNREYIGLGYALLARIMVAEGALDEAASLFIKARDVLDEVGARIHSLRTQMWYADLLLQQGNAQIAAEIKQALLDEGHKLGVYLP